MSVFEKPRGSSTNEKSEKQFKMQVTLTQPSEFIVNPTVASIRRGWEDFALRLREKNIDPRVASHVTKTHNDHPPDVHTQLIKGRRKKKNSKKKRLPAHCLCKSWEFMPAPPCITTGRQIHNLLTISESSEKPRSRYLASLPLNAFSRCLCIGVATSTLPPQSSSPSCLPEPACLSPSSLMAACLRWSSSRRTKSCWPWWAGSCSSTSSSWTESSKAA